MALFKKVNKSSQNLRGFLDVTEENPFLQPCLLCLSAQELVDNSVFGIAKVGASLARVRVKNRVNAGFDIDSVPINFLACNIGYKSEEIIGFVDKYFIPLLFNGSERVSVEVACQRFRNINFLTYCDGTRKALLLERALSERLIGLGYSEDEIKMILNQISLISLSTDRIDSKSNLSTVSFKDVLDSEVYDELSSTLVDSQDQEMLLNISPTLAAFLYKGNGDHSLKKYAYEDKVEGYISYVLTAILNNSLENKNGFHPLNITAIIESLRKVMKGGVSKEELLSVLDLSLDYDGARRYTYDEAKLRDECDLAYDRVAKIEPAFERLKKSEEEKSKQIAQLQNAVLKYSTRTNAYRIFLDSIGWQVSKEQLEDIMNSRSDKEIIESSLPKRLP